MAIGRKRKVILFDVVDESVTAKVKTNNPNPWNGRPFSQRYYEIFEKRKTLPVWHQKEEFLKVLKENQTLILVGETGSGKTT
ncbi:probable pre-mRNA-splicing factor ATP-dependent RNA helicase DEAH2, partial [Tanacetum coccineum]